MVIRFREFILTVGFTVGLGIVSVPAQLQYGQFGLFSAIAQTPSSAPSSTSPSKSSTFYDRYMQAGYAATNRRDYATALIYFKRALDERPEDIYATQAIRNVENYLGKSSPSPTPTPSPTSPAATSSKPAPTVTTLKAVPSTKPTVPNPTATAPNPPTKSAPTPSNTAPKPSTKLVPPKAPPATATVPAAKAPAAVVVIPSAPPSDAFNEQRAVALINRWLQAKTEVFAPPYDQQQVVDLTTGELLAALVKPDGVLNWLKSNRAYFRYGVQNVDSIERFVVARDRATIEVNVTEDRTLYRSGMIDPNQTDFSSQRVRFTFMSDNGVWKIADYKTVNGLLLERSILEAASLAR
ncbi:hypothetical protein OsccyDRAFT_1000 [Leptolyngbyaceae cyanobacterium JSC-12]|nr:hypothetical protein OsccyDRAFT_1000 [Leptolyngbyaceae cyanobacterium JSC-12]